MVQSFFVLTIAGGTLPPAVVGGHNGMGDPCKPTWLQMAAGGRPARADAQAYTFSPVTTPDTPPLPTADGLLDPQCPEAGRRKDRKRSVGPVMCAIYTPTPYPSLPTPPNSSSSLGSKLQIQQSVSSTRSLVDTHANIRPPRLHPPSRSLNRRALVHTAVTCRLTHAP